MKQKLISALAFCILAFLTACQEGVSAFDDPEIDDGSVAVRFQVVQVDQIPFTVSDSGTRAAIADLCSAISLAVYDSDSTKVDQVNQTSDDSDFGILSLKLAPGTYRVVIIAHNGDKAPTMTNVEKITFNNNKLTDTFYYSQPITITDATTQSVTLQRCVAMFRLAVTDQIPDEVATMKFYYTGGSSTFDALQGVGIVNSRQTENRSVTADMLTASAAGETTTFDVYTFPRADSDALTMTVTALDESETTVLETKFDDVPIQRNMITLYTGAFFQSVTNATTTSFQPTTNDEWATQSYSY